MFNFIKNLRKSYLKYQIANQTIKELSALSDRELNDIGISRSIIRYIAWDVEVSDDDLVNHNLRGWV